MRRSMRPSWVCTDASFGVSLVVGPHAAVCEAVWEEWKSKQQQVVAPPIVRYEIGNALHRMQKAGLLTPSLGAEALELALAMPIELADGPEQHRRAASIARHLSLPAVYYAHCIAVAESYGCELWTADKRLAAAAQEYALRAHLVGP